VEATLCLEAYLATRQRLSLYTVFGLICGLGTATYETIYSLRTIFLVYDYEESSAAWNRFSNARLSTLLGWSATDHKWSVARQCLCTVGDHEGWRIFFITFALTGPWTLICFGGIYEYVLVERAVARSACCRGSSVIPFARSWWPELQVTCKWSCKIPYSRSH
jgi:hypothetical protein